MVGGLILLLRSDSFYRISVTIIGSTDSQGVFLSDRNVQRNVRKTN